MSQELNVNGHLRGLLKSGNSLLLVKLIHTGPDRLGFKKGYTVNFLNLREETTVSLQRDGGEFYSQAVDPLLLC